MPEIAGGSRLQCQKDPRDGSVVNCQRLGHARFIARPIETEQGVRKPGVFREDPLLPT